MNILIECGHPSDVHLFKNLYKRLVRNHHNVIVVARDRDGMVDLLLQAYCIEYISLKKNQPGMYYKLYAILFNNISIAKIIKKYNIQYAFGRVTPYSGIICGLLRIPFIAFEDTEIATLNLRLTSPFLSKIIIPDHFQSKINLKNQFRAPTFKELAYLHPDDFSPDRLIAEKYNIDPSDPYIIIRLNAFDSYHDVGFKQISSQDLKKIIEIIQPSYNIYIISETSLPSQFKKYELRIDPEDIHSIIAYAKFIISDTGTINIEAAFLGVPAIVVHPKVYAFGNFRVLSSRYKLLYPFSNIKQVISFLPHFINNTIHHIDSNRERERLLSNYINPTDIFLSQIEQ